MNNANQQEEYRETSDKLLTKCTHRNVDWIDEEPIDQCFKDESA